MELTTVADDEAVVHDGAAVRTYPDLTPDTDYEFDGFAFRTLPRPGGELLCRFATVNDVHFGETDCGIIEGLDIGPIFSVDEGEEPFPETMNRGAVQEMGAVTDLSAVIVKGDLTSRGTLPEYQRFLDVYQGAFGDRLHFVRGNHESYYGTALGDTGPFAVSLPGLTVAVIDTTVQLDFIGQVSDATAEWLRQLAVDTAGPVLVMGHHHAWNPGSKERPEKYFGINPDDSEKLVQIFVDHPNLRGYFAGHTHRNRVRRFGLTGDRPWVEVACVKDFPGTWAEYRVYEGGTLQIHRRISTPDALVWTEKTRNMYAGTYFGYAFGKLEERCFVISHA